MSRMARSTFRQRRIRSSASSAILTLAEMLPIANERGNIPDDPNKRDPLDFVLWQAAKPGEPTWDSPWGAGTTRLAHRMQRHGRPLSWSVVRHSWRRIRSDLSAPRMRNRPSPRTPPASSHSCATGCTSGMVGYQGEKMSKSLGNLVLVSNELKHVFAGCVPALSLQPSLPSPVGIHRRRDRRLANSCRRSGDSQLICPSLTEAPCIRRNRSGSLPGRHGRRSRHAHGHRRAGRAQRCDSQAQRKRRMLPLPSRPCVSWAGFSGYPLAA